MNKYSKLLWALALAPAMVGCADDIDTTSGFEVEKPETLAQYEYLNSYGTLKSYLESASKASPDFKLGVALAADDYAKKGAVYMLANTNFMEMTAGNAMKYASIVGDDGSMNFGTVQQFIENAKNANMSIYGHTLCWHEQQNLKWLNSLIADKEIPVDPDAPGQEVTVERRCIEVCSDDMVDAAWDTQFWIMTDATFAEGDKWELSMNVRATYEASIGTQTHKGAGEYLHWAGCGTVKFTPQWTEYKASGTMDASMAGGHSFAFNINDFAAANEYYFDDISLKINGVEMIKNSSCDDDNMKDNYIAKEKRGGMVPATFVDSYTELVSGNSIPLTPEEKAEALTNELERWIKGMMEACGGYVKAWDVVNEAVSGGPRGQRYELQSANNTDGADKKFFWRDYLGDDFVRIPVKFARQYFEEFGGNPADLKLFINDYNLESDWDDNQKLKSLIEWIARWESDGETVIDGIGTQMHVTYYMNPETQKSKEEHVVKMLELLASTGKLIKISELDMGIADAEGNSIKTADVTFEQQKAMAEYYKFIVTKYFEIIPAAQQYGITQWCITDSPDGSGWRAGEPVGLWDINYARKPAYGGFCDALTQQ
ncbi:endo-1,4-beta-xylanase [uncultured Muribaculum sp.]|jgi:GH35 family endo-1,4-beta-xylanase|uniref:endo-1,4-beta-xylanase n=1 Tax=uncultured Muribaculum sp. TaxID=1918613 RepID=UPI002582A118|nr:endo-1,4-beta-xylanase [uncultured Muribaculum sp.]